MKRTKLTKEMIDKFIEESECEADAVFKIYRHVFPEWDDIESIGKWPTITQPTSVYIFNAMATKFKETPWIWFNKGFSFIDARERGLKDFEVDRSTCNIKYHEMERAA